MSSLMMALVRRSMQERLTGHHNEVVILMHLLVFNKDILLCWLNCIIRQGHMQPLVIPALDDRNSAEE
jgi:hypothetical protein